MFRRLALPLLLAFASMSGATAGGLSGGAAQVSVCFTPGANCEREIVAAIDSAKRSIRVQAYGFTAQPILHALRLAIKRGVAVELVLDRSGNFDKEGKPKLYSGAGLMAAAGAGVWIDAQAGIAHNKVIIIDGRLVVGGSYNYTANAAKKNRENVTFIESEAIAAAYIDNWTARRLVSLDFNAVLRQEREASTR